MIMVYKSFYFCYLEIVNLLHSRFPGISPHGAVLLAFPIIPAVLSVLLPPYAADAA